MFANRLRAARTSAGLSQEALAKAVNEHGLNWRQTTVAKSEKGDRPVLFVEAVVLARVLGLKVEEFLSEAGPLEELADRLRHEWVSSKERVEDAESNLEFCRHRHRVADLVFRLNNAVLIYKHNLDSGVLLDSIERLFNDFSSLVTTLPYEVYEALGIARDVRRVDEEALKSVIVRESEEIASQNVRELEENYTGEYLTNVANYLSGGLVDDAFLEFMRDGQGWKRAAAVAVTTLIAESELLR
ncbi:helix-turn-helix transcriptional regulator [Streptomyces zaomyceticus]|uniref:helix-turn-helix transcriptional regulator n=1 Tax=Streptomyces zaomyceticus TaxID=68286 RepID=UPI003674C756